MKKNVSKFGAICAFIIFLVPFFLNCRDHDDDHGDNDEAIVSICNLDDHEYRVELRKSSDDSLVAYLNIEQWYKFLDQCDVFDNLDEERYYLEIYEEGDSERTDRSDDFYLESHEIEYFNIALHGDLVNG